MADHGLRHIRLGVQGSRVPLYAPVNAYIHENIYSTKLCICVTFRSRSLHFAYDLALNNEINAAFENRTHNIRHLGFEKIMFNLITNWEFWKQLHI